MISKTDFNDLCKRVIDHNQSDELFISFSCGADSIAMFLRLKETGLFNLENSGYMYYSLYTPTWVKQYIKFFEDKHNIKIALVDSHIYYEHLNNFFLQNPRNIQYIDKALTFIERKYNIGNIQKEFSKSTISNLVKEIYNFNDDDYVCVGVKSGDSVFRRNAMKKMNGINENKKIFYPIFDFENQDVINIIKDHDEKVPYCYELFGISFEMIDYRFINKIKDFCPNNWNELVKLYPLLETIILRQEHYKPDFRKKFGIKGKQLKSNVLGVDHEL